MNNFSEIKDVNEREIPKVEQAETDEQKELDEMLNDNYDEYLNGEKASDFKYNDGDAEDENKSTS